MNINLFEFVMLVDDDYATNYYHEIVIKDSGLVKTQTFFLSAKEGIKFLKQLNANTEATFPELLFLDLNMPIMNGWEFLDQLRQIDFTQPPAVVILTTSSNPQDQERAKRDPLVIEYLMKPLEEAHFHQLYTKIKQNTLNH